MGTAPDAFDGVHRKGDYLADGVGRVRQALHPHVRGRRHRRVRADPGLVHGRLGHGRRRARASPRRRCRAASRIPRARSSRSSTTSSNGRSVRTCCGSSRWRCSRYMQALRAGQARHRRRRGEEQAQRRRPPGRAPGPGRHHGRGRAGVARCSRDPVQRLDVSPISDGAVALVHGQRGRRRPAHRRAGVDPGRRVEPRHHLLDEPRPRLPEYVENAARMAYDMAGVTEPRKQIHVAEPYDPFDYKELHHLEGLQLFDKGKAPEAAAAGVTAARRRPALLPERRAARRRQPDRRRRPHEDRRALLAAARRGRRPAGPRHARARRRAGVGRPDAGGHRGRDGHRRRAGARRPRGRDAAARRRGPTPLSDAEFRSAAGAVDDAAGRHATRGTPARRWARSSRALFEGRIVATICAQCGRTLVPPRKFCERCFRPTDRWTAGAGHRHRETFSICHVRWDMDPLDPPEIPAVIRLDDTSEGGFLHKLGEVAPDDVRIGMAVEAVWKAAGRSAPGRSSTSRTSGRAPAPDASSSPPQRGDGAASSAGRGELPVAFRYTPGVGDTAFFEALRDRGVRSARGAPSAGSRTCPRGCSASGASPELAARHRVRPRRHARVVHGRARRTSTASRSPSRSRARLVQLDGADTVDVAPAARHGRSRGRSARPDRGPRAADGVDPGPRGLRPEA